MIFNSYVKLPEGTQNMALLYYSTSILGSWNSQWNKSETDHDHIYVNIAIWSVGLKNGTSRIQAWIINHRLHSSQLICALISHVVKPDEGIFPNCWIQCSGFFSGYIIYIYIVYIYIFIYLFVYFLIYLLINSFIYLVGR